MRKIKRWTAVLLALCMAAIGFGCGDRRPVGVDIGVIEEVDEARTQLYVGNFAGGYGDNWLYALKNRFEEFYKDVSFEPNRPDKKGVQVLIDNLTGGGADIIGQVAGSRNNVFFNESLFYYDYLNSGLMADITDIVTEPLTEYGEDKTIESKLGEQQRQYLRTGQNKDRYYALPHYFGTPGISYDIDLFEKQGFYFAADPAVDAATVKINTNYDNGNDGFVIDADDTRSNGPDGKPNTSDDGLPATYDEFFMLCDYISGAGMSPIIWSGRYRRDYNQKTMSAFFADYEGAEQLELMYSFEGTAKNLVDSIDADGTVRKKAPTEINVADGWKMYSTAGIYYALSFWERLVSNRANYDSRCFNEVESNTQAEEDFILSAPESGGNAGSVAMLADGIWWFNEAKSNGSFQLAADAYGEEYGEMRNIGYLPLPKATEAEVGAGTTLSEMLNAFAFVNANCNDVQLDLAKKFLKFAYTDESLIEFTVETGTPKALEYEIPPEQLAKMTPFGRNFWQIYSTADRVYPYSTTELVLNNQSKFILSHSFYSKIGSVEYNNAQDILRPGVENHHTAKEIFEGIGALHSESAWLKDFGPFA